MEQYYELKRKLLILLRPECIHVEQYEGRDGTRTKYYLFYPLAHSSYHTPLDELEKHADWTNEQIEEWIKENVGNLPIVRLDDNIITEGHDTEDLLSPQFVRKVVSLIDKGEYKLAE